MSELDARRWQPEALVSRQVLSPGPATREKLNKKTMNIKFQLLVTGEVAGMQGWELLVSARTWVRWFQRHSIIIKIITL